MCLEEARSPRYGQLIKRVDDAVSAALLVGLEMIIAESKVSKYPTKEIYLLTDGEREPDWIHLTQTANRIATHNVSLTVVLVF